MTDEILFFSGSLCFTEDGDLDWSLMLNNGESNEEEIIES
jgi:hypothetical protein